MEKKYIKSRAKINLTLNVLARLENGYHNIESIFQRISLYDEMYIEKTNTDDIEIVTNLDMLEVKQNIIYKAYIMMKEKYCEIGGLKVRLIKNIPTQAGLGGGSANCATFLKALIEMYDLDISNDKLVQIAKELGADVTPCLYKGIVKAEGIGEIITIYPFDFKYYVLVVETSVKNATKEMFEKIDSNISGIDQEINTEKMLEAIEKKDIEQIALNMYNVFEKTGKDEKLIEKIKSDIIKSGALNSMLTGSGACIYGIYSNKEEAKVAYSKLNKKYKVHYAITYN